MSGGNLATDRLSAALSIRLKLDMSLSSLPIVEEWMDMPFSRWLDSVPMPPEMPDGESPPLVVSLSTDASMVRWSAAGAPVGVVPKLVDYMRRAGALPGDFQQVDRIGQGLEPAVIGSWIEARPGSVTTGWFVADREMELEPLRSLLGEGAWLADLGGATCRWAGRSVGEGATTDVLVNVPGPDRAAQLAFATDVFARFGLALDQAAAEQLGGQDLALGLRARTGQVMSARLLVTHPGAGAAARLCGAAGLELVPAVALVERAIAAGEIAQMELERNPAGSEVVVHYVAGSARAPSN